MPNARTRSLLAPLVLVLLAGAAVGWALLGVGRKDDVAAARAEAGARVLDLGPEEVQAIEIEAGASRVRVERAESGWELTTPSPAPADRGAVEGLLRAATQLRRRSVVSAKPDDAARARYGLAKPQGRLTFTLRGGKAVALLVGDENAFDGSLYVEGPGGSVDLVDGQARWTLLRTPDDLRLRVPEKAPPPVSR